MGKILDIIAIPLGYVIRFCYNLTGNYAIALLLFAIAMQIILLPLGIKQQKNMVKQSRMKPREMAIRKKYAGRDDKPTQQKMNDEIMKMYQDEQFNPLGGCLPLLIQFPILFALFRVVMYPLRYICELSDEVIGLITTRLNDVYQIAVNSSEQIKMVAYIRDLGVENFSDIAPTLTADSLPKFTMFGSALDLSMAPRDNIWSILLIIPILTFVVTLLSQKLTKKFSYQANQPAQTGMSMKILEWSMPLMSVYFCFMYAGAIGVYWIFRNILSTLQQFILSRVMPYPVFTEEDYKAAEKAAGALPERKKSEKKVRSLHRIDEEDNPPPEPEKPAKSSLGSALITAPVKDDAKKDEAVTDDDGITDSDDSDSEAADEAKDETDSASAEPVKAPDPNAPKTNYSKTGKNYKKK